MDTSEYLKMFLAESREHLQSLNLAIVRLEEAPEDGETLDEIFRIAHTLKGMSATMGFARIAALTHKMEDVFELLRQRTGGIERRVIDVVLECLDALSEAVDAIDAHGEERLDPEPLIERLHALVRMGDDEAAGDGGMHVVITLAPDTMMPSVRAFMALAALADHGEVVASDPAEDALDGFTGTRIEATVRSDHEADAVAASLRAVPDVAAVEVREPDAAAAPAAPASAPAAAPATAVEPQPEAVPAGEEPPAPAPAEPAPAPAAEAPRPARTGSSRTTSSTVRVDAERLDQLMHLMGELVVDRTRVESLAARSGVPELAHAVADLTRSSQALQALVMQVRMIPVDSVFMRFPRLVRDLSGKLGKQVDLVLTGRETELDRTVIDTLGDPLVHLVRNSLDHALEPPAERAAAGKPETGRLEIAARHAGGNVLITVSDDGRGIDPARVARRAAERGLIAGDAVESVDMPRAIELLFAPGFSTAEQTSDLSGRGVGMDAVRTAIRDLGGSVVMTSGQGAGTTVQIRLPLTLAIMPALLVESNAAAYAIPLERVERTLNLADHTVRTMAGRPMLMLPEGVLPLVDLAGALDQPPCTGATNAVIARGGDRRLALAVGRLVGQRELVTRPLPPEVGAGVALSGGAVLSDGSIAFIVDCDALAGDRARPPAAADAPVSLTTAA